MSLVLLFLKSWWKEIAVALLVASAFFYVYHLKSTISDQALQINNLSIENQIVKQNNTKLEASINATNEAIGKLAEGSVKTQKAFNSLNVNVKSQVVGLDAKLAQVLADKKPADCAATIKYLVDAVKDYQK